MPGFSGKRLPWLLRYRGGPMTERASSPRGPAHCLNCGAPLGEPRPRFWGACGPETHVRAPRLGEFLQQFGGAYFATEGALWRTLGLLLFKPGELTARYLAGRRKHYVLPLRLYLSISLVVLLLVRVLGSGAVQVNTGDAAEVARENQNLTLTLGQGHAGLRAGVFYCESLPGWVCKRLQRRIDFDPKQMTGEVEALKDSFLANLGGAMFLLLPSFALALKLVYWNRRLRYTEHLVLALHVHSFWFLAVALAMLQVDWITTLTLLMVPVYTWLALRRVYGGRWWPRLLRAGLLALVYLVVLGLAMAGVGLWTLLS
jgi:hypothetical protein